MKKLVMLFSLLLLFALSSWAQVTVTIGTGTSTDRYPLDDYFVYSQSQCLYLATEIGTGGTITKLRWYRNDAGADPNAIGTTEVWLMETGNTTLTGTAWEGPGTLVATISNIDLGSGSGWYEIDITDFLYSGTQNLLVSVYTQNAPYTSPHSYWRYTSATDMARLGQSDTENPPTMSLSGNRPNIQFDIIPSTPYFTITPSSLVFGYVAYPGTSTEHTYTVSGDNLTAGPVVVTAPSGFGVSLTTGGPYTSSVNISYTPPILSSTTIYSNFSPLAAGTFYSDNITHVGGGTSGNIAVSGTSELTYCTPTYVNGGTSDFITQVTLNTLSQATAFNLTPYYIDYTTTQNAIPDIPAGTSAQLNLAFSSDGNQFNGVWIDFNLNGIFEATEFFTSNTNAGSNGSAIINIAVPVSATLGNVRMRIRGGDDVQPAASQACGASGSTWGQAQDYLVNITAPPACIPPSDLTVTNITNTSADLGWTESGTAALWNIELGNPGFVPGTGANLTGVTGTTSNPWTAIGGAGNTTYEFYVQADCGGTLSSWSGPYSFTTLCSPISALPYTEGFEGATFPPDCWSNTGWALSLYGDPNTGLEWAYSNLAGSELTTPSFTLSSNSQFRFWYRVEDASYAQDMDVLLSTDGINFTTTIANYIGITNDTYNEEVIDLSAYTGQTVTIRFTGLTGTGGFDYGVLVDDVTMEEIPSCPVPTALTATNITQNSADLGWTENGTATIWNVELGVPGFLPGTGTNLTEVTGTTNNPWTAIGGTSNTTYEFYVQSDCGGDESIWAGPYSFTTICDVVTTFPFTEDFTAGLVPPTCWSEIITNTTENWEYNTSGFANVNYDYSQDEWLVTPVLDFSTLTHPYLNFDWMMSYYWGVDPNNNYDLICKVSTDGGATWDSVWSEAAEGIFANFTWYTKTINLDAYAGQSNVKIAWQYLGDDGAQGAIDNILVDEALVPSISSLGSTSGCVGSDLVINGTNLDNATSVTIGGTPSVITANTGTAITVTIGTGTTGTVAVTTIGGTGTSIETFTVNQLPAVFTVSGGGTYCAGGTGVAIMLDGSESGVNYDLSTTPITTLPGTGSALTFGPSAFESGIITITATDPATTCSILMTGNASVTANPSPTAVTATASSNLICAGTSIDLFSSATSGSTVTSTVLTESFENSGAIPAGWGEDLDADGNATDAALTYESASVNPTGFSAFDGTYFVRFNSFTVGSGNSARVKQTTSFSTVGYTGLTVNFAWTQDNQYTSANDNVVVQYSTDGTTWTTAGTSFTRVGTADIWTTQTVNLPVAVENQSTLYIAFLFTSGYGNDCHLDNVVINGQIPASATFTWTSLPSGFNSTDQNPVGVTPTATTEYIVTAQNSYSCTTSASATVTVDPCTSIPESNNGISVNVIPNPSNGMFYLNVEGINEAVTLNIYSINGQVIYTEQVDNSGLINKPIDLKSYPKGMYFLRLINNNMTHTEKIIIE